MPVIPLTPSRLLSISDGDTPEVKMGLRMLAVDTPELHFPAARDPASQDPLLEALPQTAAWQKLPKALQDYLLPRLEKAGTRQQAWGAKAKAAFEAVVADGLAVKGTLRKRALFLACGHEVFDRYGRILAYVGPLVPKSERGDSPPPDTFNLRMLQGGWAAPCIHKGNLLKPADMDLVIAAVQNARKEKLGFWADTGLILHGYEFRSLCRLANGEAGFTYPITDARTLKAAKPTTLKAVEYIQIPEEYRVFG
jgi:endonuclease YncB( thermonuclease family)